MMSILIANNQLSQNSSDQQFIDQSPIVQILIEQQHNTMAEDFLDENRQVLNGLFLNQRIQSKIKLSVGLDYLMSAYDFVSLS